MQLFDNFEEFDGVSAAVEWAIFIVACLIAIAFVVSTVVSVWLFIKYVKFNIYIFT